MTVITFTEAITELAFGERRTAADVFEADFAEMEAWTQEFRTLSIAAHVAAEAQGRDLEHYRARKNPLTLNEDEVPREIATLFAACALREQRRSDYARAMGAAARRIVQAASQGKVKLFGRLDGRGESKEMPDHECRHIVYYPDFGFDVLTVRNTLQTWSHALVRQQEFGPWLEAERRRPMSHDQTKRAIEALCDVVKEAPNVTASAAAQILRENYGIDYKDELIKRDLMPEARRIVGIAPRGPGRPRKSGNENREKK